VTLSYASTYEGPCPSCGAEEYESTRQPGTMIRKHVATVPAPGMDTIEAWVMDAETTEATDGCPVDPDGRCEHGHQSWLLRLGLI